MWSDDNRGYTTVPLNDVSRYFAVRHNAVAQWQVDASRTAEQSFFIMENYLVLIALEFFVYVAFAYEKSYKGSVVRCSFVHLPFSFICKLSKPTRYSIIPGPTLS